MSPQHRSDLKAQIASGDFAGSLRANAKGVSRGVRNRNPLNIRYAAANHWQGKLDEGENTDEGCAFEQFEDAVFGLRAAIRLMRTHHRRGADTIRRLATVWAPPGENPHLDAYIRTVAKHAGIDADTVIDLRRDAHLRPVLLGMIRAENGVQPYDDTTIATALALAAADTPVRSVTRHESPHPTLPRKGGGEERGALPRKGGGEEKEALAAAPRVTERA